MQHQHRLVIHVHLTPGDRWQAWISVTTEDEFYQESIDLPDADPNRQSLERLTQRDRELIKKRLFQALSTNIDQQFPAADAPRHRSVMGRCWRAMRSLIILSPRLGMDENKPNHPAPPHDDQPQPVKPPPPQVTPPQHHPGVQQPGQTNPANPGSGPVVDPNVDTYKPHSTP